MRGRPGARSEHGAVAAHQEQRRPRGRGNLPSLILFGLAIVLLIIAVVYYRRDQKESGPLPAPTALPGRNTSIDVVDALERQGLKVDYQHRTVQSPELTPPGQPLNVDGAVLYVFVYTSGPTAAQKEAARVDQGAILPPDAGTATAATGPPPRPRVFTHSNVIAVLVGGSDALVGKVQKAITDLR